MTLILIPAVTRGTLSSLQGTSNSFLLRLLLENLPCVCKSLSKDPRGRRVVGGFNIKLTKAVRSYQEDRSRLSAVYGRTRGSGHLEIREAQTGLNETFFITQTVGYGDILPRGAVQSWTAEVFKAQLRKASTNLVCPQSCPRFERLKHGIEGPGFPFFPPQSLPAFGTGSRLTFVPGQCGFEEPLAKNGHQPEAVGRGCGFLGWGAARG